MLIKLATWGGLAFVVLAIVVCFFWEPVMELIDVARGGKRRRIRRG